MSTVDLSTTDLSPGHRIPLSFESEFSAYLSTADLFIIIILLLLRQFSADLFTADLIDVWPNL